MSKGTPNNGGTPKATKGNVANLTPFKVGNKGGPGNPWPKLTAALKSAIARYSEEEYGDAKTYAQVMAEDLWRMATGELQHEDDKTFAAQRWAMQTILDRALGKPKETIDITGTFTLAEFYRALAPDLLAS